jgi:hypothetical protein
MKWVVLHHSLHASGADPINIGWYINGYVYRTLWPKEVLYRGLDLHADEYVAADEKLMSMLKKND